MLRRKMFGLWFAALSLATGGALAQSGGRGKGRDRGRKVIGTRLGDTIQKGFLGDVIHLIPSGESSGCCFANLACGPSRIHQIGSDVVVT